MEKHCPKCNLVFSKARSLKQHLQNTHHVGMVKCRECGCWVLERKMRSHVKRKHEFKDYRSYLIKSGVIKSRMTEQERSDWLSKGENRKTLPKVHIVQGGAPSLGKRK